MKIFILLSRVPFPLEKGDKVRAFNQIRTLSKEHEIILYALHEKDVDAEAIEILKPYCKTFKVLPLHKNNLVFRMLHALLRGLPFQVGYFYHKKIKNEIQEAIKNLKPDIIYCQLCRTAEYVKDIQGTPKVLDLMDAFSKGAERRSQKESFLVKWLFKLEAQRMRNYESEMLEKFNRTTIISAQDREYIYNPLNKNIAVISNGVDFDFFKPFAAEKIYDCVFSGNMSYPPNIDGAIFLAENIFPLVLQKFPNAKLLIAGANPSPKIKKLQSENIHISGWMDDIRMAYASAKIFVAPLRMGSGVQNKILEAVSMGLPCITSALVAKPLGMQKDALLTGENEEEYAAHIISLMQNPLQAESLHKNALAFIEHAHNWEQINKGLENIFDELKDTKI